MGLPVACLDYRLPTIGTLDSREAEILMEERGVGAQASAHNLQS